MRSAHGPPWAVSLLCYPYGVKHLHSQPLLEAPHLPATYKGAITSSPERAKRASLTHAYAHMQTCLQTHKDAQSALSKTQVTQEDTDTSTQAHRGTYRQVEAGSWEQEHPAKNTNGATTSPGVASPRSAAALGVLRVSSGDCSTGLQERPWWSCLSLWILRL